ncbi:RNA polymerase II-associated [Dipodascopsis tothii]|uniref:RNA polymerase II-associated n=1 Tax=Dipodascopsis tothii TaxID=44089 RepID=UPI0034CD0B0B
MSRAVRQDYIARVRYQNKLPPPPCPPKLLEIGTPIKSYASAAFLSSLVQEQPLNVDIDTELGMPLDLTIVPGVFDNGDDSRLFPDRNPAPMHPKDRALLRDPASLGGVSRSQPGVSFLRRTEYIASEHRATRATGAPRRTAAAAIEVDEPQHQIDAVEETFAQAERDVAGLRHPTKKHLTVAESWEALPDVEIFDLNHLLVKMTGASGKGKDAADARYDVAVLRPVATGADDWVSFFLPDEDTAARYKDVLARSAAADAAAPADDAVYRFAHVRDYDMDYHVGESNEFFVSFDDATRAAYFAPISARSVLKRRRVVKADVRRPAPDVATDVAAIEIAFRELSGEERVERDSLRQQFGYVVPE